MSPEIASGVNVACPSCRKTVSVPPGMGGRLLKCPLCQAQFASPPEAGKAPPASPVPPAAASQAPPYGPAMPAFATGPQAALPSFVPQQAALPSLASGASAARLLGPAFTGPQAALLGPKPAEQMQAEPAPKTYEQMKAESEAFWDKRREKEQAGQTMAGTKSKDEPGVMNVLTSAASSLSGTFGSLARTVLTVKDRLFSFGDQIAGFAGHANPNTQATYAGSVEMLRREFGRAFIPLVERSSAFIQRIAPVAESAGHAGAGVLGGAAKLARPIAEPVFGGIASLIGLLSGGYAGSATNSLHVKTAFAAAAGEDGKGGKPPLRSMAGLPGAHLGDAISYYDQGLKASLELGSVTLEAKEMTDKIEQMSKDLGGHLLDLKSIMTDIRNAGPSFR